MINIISFFKNLGRAPEENWIVSIDDGLLTCKYEKSITHIDLKNIEKIFIHTTDEGPFSPDIFWILEGGKTVISYPQGAPGEAAATKLLMEIPGIDPRALIHASLSYKNEQFLFYDKNNLIDPSEYDGTKSTKS